MSGNPLQKFFKLESNPTLFEQALKPPSCGGDESFKALALIGDNFINNVLHLHFKKRSIKDTGIITIKTKRFHNNRTLVKIGEHFHVSDYMNPIDYNYQPSPNDIKESIESLIGVCIQANNEEIASKIVIGLYQIAKENNFLDVDYISMLNQILQKEGTTKIPWEDERVGGLDHLPKFKTVLNISYQGNDYHAESDIFSNKTDSKRDAAKKILKQLGLIFEDYGNEFYSEQNEQKIPLKAVQSLDEREIIFSKQEYDESSTHTMQVKTNTGEKIIDWAKRKAKKNPFGMLLLLSGRVESVKGSSWYATTPGGELTLLNLNLGNLSFFEVGIGISRTASRKNAAQKIIINSGLFDWLNQNHPNDYI